MGKPDDSFVFVTKIRRVMEIKSDNYNYIL